MKEIKTMAKYKINWLKKNTADWYTISVLPQKEDGTWGVETTDISVNRVSKNGQKFDNFDTFAPGVEIDAEPWQSSAGKNYLYPPKPKLEAPNFIKQASNSAYKAQQIEKTMDRKEQGIAKSQDNKEWGIKVSSTMNKAIDLSIAENNASPECILKWRKWIWNNWDINLDDTDAITGKLN